MLNKILTTFGIGSGSPPQSTDGPYRDASANFIYQLQFCDRPDLIEPYHNANPQPPWSILFRNPPDFQELARIAGDQRQESRIRALAFNALRAAGKPVPQKEHLGTIIELRLPEGLDSLAVFGDCTARYINHSGKLAIVESPPHPFENEIHKVIEASKPIVAAIGPWDKDRLPAPSTERNVRLTFLVSDGLYFGEGPFNAMQRDPLAAPVISAGITLLKKLSIESLTA